MNNKIIAIVKFNDHFAYVLEKKPELKYTKYENITIVGTDGCICECYGYERPSGSWKAFAGRKFDLELTDGTTEHCYGQWWDSVTRKAREVINDKIIRITARDVAGLRRCYVFTGYYAKEKEIEKLRSEYTGKIYGYDEYEKILKELK